MSQSDRKGAYVALLALTLIWGFNWIVMKQAMRYSGPFEFSALRYLFGTLALFAVLAVRRVSLRPTPLGQTVLIGLAQTAGFQALVQWALVNGDAGKTTLLAYTMPFWVILLAWFLLADRPTPRQWAGLGLAALGLVLVIQPWAGGLHLASTLLAIGGGSSWALGTVLSKRLFARADIDPLRLTAWQMLAGSVALIVLALLIPERDIAWTPYFGFVLAYNALLASGLAWALWLLIVHRLPTAVAGLTSLAVPMTGVLLAWAILGERPDGFEGAGIVLIAGALLLAIWRPRQKQAS